MDYETLAFESHAQFRKWLAENSTTTVGIWLRIFKKASNMPTVTYAQALDEALCFGWIDGQRKSLDELSFIQKFTPRRQRSMWSKRNIEHVERLVEAGLMAPAGLQEVKRAQLDGRWAAAYDTPSTMKAPEYFLIELHKYPNAEQFYNTLNKTNKYAIAWRLQILKTEAARARHCEKIIAMLDAGEKPASSG